MIAAFLNPAISGSNVQDDSALGLEIVIGSTETGGIPSSITGESIEPFYVAAGQTGPNNVTGLYIGDQNAEGVPGNLINSAILVSSQTVGPNVYSIKTLAGPVDFGDVISPGILTLAEGLAEITTGYIGPAIFTGTGTNDLTSGGTYTGTSNLIYCVQIDSTGTPDTFKWGADNCATFPNTGVAITGAAQSLSNGVTVTFASTTTHTIGDHWTFTATAALGDGFEFNCADCDTPTAEGAVCTNTIDNAGARAVYIRGAAHCF
jgi:hypothetical protein